MKWDEAKASVGQLQGNLWDGNCRCLWDIVRRVGRVGRVGSVGRGKNVAPKTQKYNL